MFIELTYSSNKVMFNINQIVTISELNEGTQIVVSSIENGENDVYVVNENYKKVKSMITIMQLPSPLKG